MYTPSGPEPGMNGPEAPPSRTRQYAERRKAEQKQDHTAELEQDLEDEKRRTLRLSRQLDEETALRARAERTSRETEQQLETVKAELEKANASNRRKPRASKSGERAEPSGKTSGGAQRVDGSATPKRAGNAKPADGGSNPIKKQPEKPAGSSRKRGSVK